MSQQVCHLQFLLHGMSSLLDTLRRMYPHLRCLRLAIVLLQKLLTCTNVPS